MFQMKKMNCDKDRPPQKHYVLQLLFNTVALNHRDQRADYWTTCFKWQRENRVYWLVTVMNHFSIANRMPHTYTHTQPFLVIRTKEYKARRRKQKKNHHQQQNKWKTPSALYCSYKDAIYSSNQQYKIWMRWIIDREWEESK